MACPCPGASAPEDSLAGLVLPQQPSQKVQGDTRPVTLCPFRGWPFSKEAGQAPSRVPSGRDRQGPLSGSHSALGEKYAKEQHGPGYSFCPPRPCVLLTARKISQSGGLRWLWFRGGSWDKDGLSHHPPSLSPCGSRPCTATQWLIPDPTVLPPGLCSCSAFPLEDTSPANSTHPGPIY